MPRRPALMPHAPLRARAQKVYRGATRARQPKTKKKVVWVQMFRPLSQYSVWRNCVWLDTRLDDSWPASSWLPMVVSAAPAITSDHHRSVLSLNECRPRTRGMQRMAARWMLYCARAVPTFALQTRTQKHVNRPKTPPFASLKACMISNSKFCRGYARAVRRRGCPGGESALSRVRSERVSSEAAESRILLK
eukprot:5531543-Pleurochrysis_carterae.AAC.2